MRTKANIPMIEVPPRPISRYEAERLSWGKVVFYMKCRIIRNGFNKVLSFSLSGYRYDKFTGMEGTFSGFDEDGKEYIISLRDTDIIEVLSDNRDSAKAEYERLVCKALENNRMEIDRWYEQHKAESKEVQNHRQSFWSRIIFRHK